MVKFIHTAEQVQKYHHFAWLVSKDIKPASEFCVYSEDEYSEVVDYVSNIFPDLKVYRRHIESQSCIIEVHIYKYDHICFVLDELSKNEGKIGHILNAYIYGIPPHMVEEFLGKE